MLSLMVLPPVLDSTVLRDAVPTCRWSLQNVVSPELVTGFVAGLLLRLHSQSYCCTTRQQQSKHKCQSNFWRQGRVGWQIWSAVKSKRCAGRGIRYPTGCRSEVEPPDLICADHADTGRDECISLEYSHKLGKLTFDMPQKLLQCMPWRSLASKGSKAGQAVGVCVDWHNVRW